MPALTINQRWSWGYGWGVAVISVGLWAAIIIGLTHAR